MSEITKLREIRPAPSAAGLEEMRSAARERFVAGTGSRRARHRRGLKMLAGGLTAAAAATAAAALALTSGPVTAPAQHATGHTRTVVTAAWTVRQDADGVVTIYLRQYENPAGLQRTLRADGINAIVRRIPSVLQTIPRPAPPPGWPSRKARTPAWPSRKKAGLNMRRPACKFTSTNLAPRAVQRRVVSFAGGQDLPVAFIIHPDAMPQGSALFLTFLAGMTASFKNDNTGIVALPPFVLNNDTVPACVTRGAPSSAPRGA